EDEVESDEKDHQMTDIDLFVAITKDSAVAGQPIGQKIKQDEIDDEEQLREDIRRREEPDHASRAAQDERPERIEIVRLRERREPFVIERHARPQPLAIGQMPRHLHVVARIGREWPSPRGMQNMQSDQRSEKETEDDQPALARLHQKST